ncbi:MAG: TerB family tellurite resistance protein [Flavisolibacter sp.]
MQDIPITNEQEAAVAILFALVMANNQSMSQAQIEQLSRMLVLSSKFRSSSLNDLTIKALSLQAAHGSKALIERSAPLVSDDFKETLFAMCCEIMTNDGKIDDNESEILAMVALYLGMSVESMKMMLTTYLIRNRWNVQIIEQE